jgi:hypothetical protein
VRAHLVSVWEMAARLHQFLDADSLKYSSFQPIYDQKYKIIHQSKWRWQVSLLDWEGQLPIKKGHTADSRRGDRHRHGGGGRVAVAAQGGADGGGRVRGLLGAGAAVRGLFGVARAPDRGELGGQG